MFNDNVLRQCYKCNQGEWQHGRMLQNNNRVRQGLVCHLSSSTFFSNGLCPDALEEHDEKVSIDGRNFTNLRFADDIDALAEEEQEPGALV